MGIQLIKEQPQRWNGKLDEPLTGRVSSHSGRRTGMTTKAKAGMSIDQMQRSSHHKSVQNALNYVDADKDMLAEPSAISYTTINYGGGGMNPQAQSLIAMHQAGVPEGLMREWLLQTNKQPEIS